MSTLVNCLAMWGLVQLLFIWCWARAGNLREIERQRYRAPVACGADWVKIEVFQSAGSRPRLRYRGSHTPSRSGLEPLASPVSIARVRDGSGRHACDGKR
jgi:hypothetical protein